MKHQKDLKVQTLGLQLGTDSRLSLELFHSGRQRCKPIKQAALALLIGRREHHRFSTTTCHRKLLRPGTPWLPNLLPPKVGE